MIAWLLRKITGAAVWAYFRRIDAEGTENVPATGALILASNHVNALVDPLVIQFVLPRRITLTAKASLAKNPFLGFLMRVFGVLRFHRPTESGRDVAREANRMAIEACREHLTRGEALCIFPEGKSHSEPSMLPFHHGLARIALGYDGPLQVVPVGLYFEQKERFRSAVSVRFGPPLDPADFANDPAGLTRELRARIEALTAHFERPEDVELAEFVGRLLESAGAPPRPLRDEAPLTEYAHRLQRVAAGYQQLRRGSPAELAALEDRVRAFRKELQAPGVDPAEVYLPMRWGRALHFVLSELEIVLVGGIIAAWGWLNHILPFLVVRAVARRLSKEQDQWASNAIYPAIAVYPLFYALQTLLVGALTSVAWALLYALLLPFGGAYYVLWRDRVGGAWRRTRTFLRWRRDPALRERLAEQGRGILRDLRALAATPPR